MRFYPADPDIATIFNRIVNGDIDIQPDFQRGEVWPVQKQQRLIDSVLRNWIVPPVLVIAAADGIKQEVLDGQQRLAAIRDFKLNKFAVDGDVDPPTLAIQSLHGLYYKDLPVEMQRAFDRSTIRIFEARDYLPDEPAEIFFRLNQPTALTSAEKRNAFYGPVRSQIRAMAERISQSSSIPTLFGFSNSRMAYDDVLARLICILEFGTLHTKVTAVAVTSMYRRQIPLADHIFNRMQYVLDALEDIGLHVIDITSGQPWTVRLSKATALSWLLFLWKLGNKCDPLVIAKFMLDFEKSRQSIVTDNRALESEAMSTDLPRFQWLGNSLHLFNDRATARVADVSSVLIRDFVIWLAWHNYAPLNAEDLFSSEYELLHKFIARHSHISLDNLESEMLLFMQSNGWGRNF